MSLKLHHPSRPRITVELVTGVIPEQGPRPHHFHGVGLVVRPIRLGGFPFSTSSLPHTHSVFLLSRSLLQVPAACVIIFRNIASSYRFSTPRRLVCCDFLTTTRPVEPLHATLPHLEGNRTSWSSSYCQFEFPARHRFTIFCFTGTKKEGRKIKLDHRLEFWWRNSESQIETSDELERDLGGGEEQNLVRVSRGMV